MGRPNSTFIFTSPDIWMGEFRLPPDDPLWSRTNTIGGRAPLIAFPHTTVGIAQEGRPSVVADPMRAVLYAAGQPYRREVLSPDGDRCSFVTFSHGLAADAAADFDPAADDSTSYRFPFVAAGMTDGDYLLQQQVRSHLAGDGVDHDAVRESLYWLLARVVANGYRTEGGASRRRRASTVLAHVDAVDAVRAAAGADLEARVSLDDVAALVHLSPFHLARVFRAQTGLSIHAYRTELRLRASVERISDGERLVDVAAAVGFASQAHLTDRFRRAYGMTPHAWRLALRTRRALGLESSRIVEASGAAARIA